MSRGTQKFKVASHGLKNRIKKYVFFFFRIILKDAFLSPNLPLPESDDLLQNSSTMTHLKEKREKKKLALKRAIPSQHN